MTFCTLHQVAQQREIQYFPYKLGNMFYVQKCKSVQYFTVNKTAQLSYTGQCQFTNLNFLLGLTVTYTGKYQCQNKGLDVFFSLWLGGNEISHVLSGPCENAINTVITGSVLDFYGPQEVQKMKWVSWKEDFTSRLQENKRHFIRWTSRQIREGREHATRKAINCR